MINRAMGGEQDKDYVKALSACQSMADVKALVEEYRELAKDAVEAAKSFTEQDWPEFTRGLVMERRGKFAGEEWSRRFAVILMPLPMMRISEIADQFQAPFGVAWARCRDLRPDLLEVK